MAEQIYRIKLRRDTTTNWETNNPILESGEIGIDLTLNRFKIGTGITWNETEWFAYSISELEEVTEGDIQNALANYYTETEIDGLLENVLLQIPTNISQLTNDIGYITSVSWNEVEEKPTFATVATSGDYDDLTNKPTIPTATSQLTNDSGFLTTETEPDFNSSPAKDITSTDIENWNNKSDFSGSYNDLTDKPTIPSATSQLTNDSGFITGVSWSEVTEKPTFATVATSGSYTDLTDKPTIPSAPVQSDWNEADTTSLAYIQNKPTIPTVPTNVSSFTNDAGYITNAVSNLLYYYTKTEVNTLIGQISTLHLQVVETLPVSDISTNTIYLVPKQDAETDNIYDEFIYVNNAWEYIGSTETDLTDYYTKSEVDTIVANITIDWSDVQNKPTLSISNGTITIGNDSITPLTEQTQVDWEQSNPSAVDYIKNKPTLATVATTGNYDDLTNKPTIPSAPVQSDWNESDTSSLAYIENKPSIPTNTSDLNNDSGFITGVDWNDIQDKPAFADVATTGNYDDLTNKPTIPTVNDAKLTITQNREEIGTFSANAADNVTIDITGGTPSYTELTIDEEEVNATIEGNQVIRLTNPQIVSINFIFGEEYLTGDKRELTSTVYFSTPDEGVLPTFSFPEQVNTYGNFNDLEYSVNYIVSIQGNNFVLTPSDGAVSVSWDDIEGKPDFAAVATSGSYNDLTDTPAIPVVPDYVVTGQTMSYQIWTGTQTEYDNLQEYSATTLYFIKETV